MIISIPSAQASSVTPAIPEKQILQEEKISYGKAVLTCEDPAQLIGVNLSTVLNLSPDNIIPHRRSGRKIIIPLEEFLEWLSES